MSRRSSTMIKEVHDQELISKAERYLNAYFTLEEDSYIKVTKMESVGKNPITGMLKVIVSYGIYNSDHQVKSDVTTMEV